MTDQVARAPERYVSGSESEQILVRTEGERSCRRRPPVKARRQKAPLPIEAFGKASASSDLAKQLFMRGTYGGREVWRPLCLFVE
jgi:hypothetical protein